jgi:Na+/proline symporter
VVPLFLGVYWARATQAGAIACIACGTLLRGICYVAVPPSLAGLDTLLPPAVSGVVFVLVSLLTVDSAEDRSASLLVEPAEVQLGEAR